MVGKGSLDREKILVADDEPAILEVVAQCLESVGYDVVMASSGTEALRAFFQHRPDLVLLDIMMPGMDGMQVCQRIREVSTVPVIFLSARGGEDDKVRGLTLGSDDYIVKPVGMKELVARVQAAFRRARMPPPDDPETLYRDDVVMLDVSAHKAFVRGRAVDLTPLEYGLLHYLVQNANKALSTDQILDRVWGENYDSPDVVKWYVSQLRRKIEENPATPRLIVTVRGLGYRYEKPAPQRSPGLAEQREKTG